MIDWLKLFSSLEIGEYSVEDAYNILKPHLIFTTCTKRDLGFGLREIRGRVVDGKLIERIKHRGIPHVRISEA